MPQVRRRLPPSAERATGALSSVPMTSSAGVSASRTMMPRLSATLSEVTKRMDGRRAALSRERGREREVLI